MKIKNIIIAFHVCMMIIFAVMLMRLRKIQFESVDIVAINSAWKEVEENLEVVQDDPSGIENLERQYHCKITFVTDPDYMSTTYHAYSCSDTVLDYIVEDKLCGKIIFPRDDNKINKTKKEITYVFLIVLVLIFLLTDSLLLFLYARIIRPFSRLQKFAGNIAYGDFDLPLEMNRHNYFGAFTESFDIMRTELKAAKEGEARANQSKKELVASLSHDIKTPVATIKALCEILEIKLADMEEVTKVHTIGVKADLIDQLISNMFHATLSELTALKINIEQQESTIITTMIEDMNHYGKIIVENELPTCLIQCDPLRLTQVIGNIISNSYKYAGTNIWIKFWETKEELFVCIRDEGESLNAIDLALVCEKFYRGNNAEGKTGAGLGLYLAKMFMEGMGGSLTCEADHGFQVILSLQKVGKKG